MSRRYDTRTTIFSPEGRLYQVEYAMEAIEHAGTCLGILASDGVILAAERKITNKLLDDTVFSEKIYRLDDNTACSVAGITSDANVLTAYLRKVAQWYLQEYQECIPVEQLIMRLCDIKQSYTQYGGKRPFGVSILYMGWDPHFGFQLYQSDPSGNYGGWKATCIGSNHQAAISLLKQDYKETPSLNDALQLAVKVLHKTLDSTKLNADKVEIATLTRVREEGDDNDRTQIRVLPADEVNALIKVYNEKEEARKREEKAKEERAKQAKEAASSSTS